MKSFLIVAVLVITITVLALKLTEGQQPAPSKDGPQRSKQVFTDPNAFRATLVEMVRQTDKYNGADYEHHANLHAATGPWGKILAERDAILAEGLGPDYKSNSQLSLLEVEVLYNLGKLDIVRNYESFQKVRAGNPFHK